MAKRLRVAPHLSASEIEQRYKFSGRVKERNHWQVIRLLQDGRSSEEIARIVGYTVPWVRQIVSRYNRLGPSGLGDQRGAAGGQNRLLNASLQGELARVMEGPVPDDLGGGLWNGVKVAAWLSEKLQRPVSRQRGREALHAVGYSCQVPRPRHVKADEPQQEAFKKNWRKE